MNPRPTKSPPPSTPSTFFLQNRDTGGAVLVKNRGRVPLSFVRQADPHRFWCVIVTQENNSIEFNTSPVFNESRKRTRTWETVLSPVFTKMLAYSPPQWNNVKNSISSVFATVNAETVSIEVNTENLEIYADLLIEKVFFNLIENALRHGEHVTVRV